MLDRFAVKEESYLDLSHKAYKNGTFKFNDEKVPLFQYSIELNHVESKAYRLSPGIGSESNEFFRFYRKDHMLAENASLARAGYLFLLSS